MPAANGGGPCPDKIKEKNLYYEVKDCLKSDCEKFHPGEWSAWSPCSSSCGEGTKTKQRKCYSTTTLQQVADHQCANDKDYFRQSTKCKLQECPVDGGWGPWDPWSNCDHSCINHPDNGEDKTKGKRTRKRYCNNPPAAYKGKKCQKDSKYKWLSHENAEMDKTACITELTKKNTPGEVVTPWCPENCILTEWCEWSACSQTCIISRDGPTVGYNTAGYIATGTTSQAQAKNIVLHAPREPSTFPTRERVRTVLKKARFSGTCPTEAFWTKKEGDDDSTLRQYEECKLCKEHCVEVGGQAIVNWKKLTYPHPKDPSCLGYCPVDCKWGEWCKKADCKKSLEDYFDEIKEEIGKKADAKIKSGLRPMCYNSEVSLYLYGEKQIREANDFNNDLQSLVLPSIRKLKNKQDKKFKPKPPEELPSLKKIHQGWLNDDDLYLEIWEKVEVLYRKDIRNLKKLLKTETERWAEPPVIDGLYGGKACQRETPDKKKLTIRKNENEGFDKNTMENGRPREYMVTWNECELKICTPNYQEINDGGNDIKNCEYYGWSKWGDWGQCTKKCGAEGKRERKRKCVNACDDDKETTENVRERCPPFKNNIVKKEYTDTDTTVCAPCPVEESSHWSEWGEWQVEKGPQCGSGKRVETRSRACIAGKDRTKNCPGNDKQTKEFQLTPCPTSTEGGSYNQPDGYSGGGDGGNDDNGGNGGDGGDGGDDGEDGGDGGDGMYPGADGDEGGQGDGGDGGAGGDERYGNDTEGEGDGEDGMYPGADNDEGDNDGMYPGGGPEEDMGDKYPANEAGDDYFDEYDTREEDESV